MIILLITSSALLALLMEQGCGIGPGKDKSRPADILIPNWSLSGSAASGASAAAGKQKKMACVVSKEAGFVSL